MIRAGDLGDRTVVLEINGSKVAELRSNQSYSGVYSAGRLRFTFADMPTTIDAYAIANEEHVYELQIVAPKGQVGARPVLVLKDRKTTIAGLPSPADVKPPPLAPLAVEVSEPPSPANTKIVLVGSAGANFAVVINGRRVATIRPDSTWSAVYTPGRIEIAVPGPRYETKAFVVLVPNEELVFEIAAPPMAMRYKFGLFGLREIPDMVKGTDPTVTLKRRTVMFAAPPQPADASLVPAQPK